MDYQLLDLVRPQTFLAVYFGSVGINKSRHAVTCGLIADFTGITTAIFICYFFFG